MKKLFKRLTIVSCCALAGFVVGRQVSTPVAAVAPAIYAAESPADLAEDIPVPDRAGRVPFAELYRSLRSASYEKRSAYLGSLEKLPVGPDRRAALTAFFQCIASINPQAAAELVREVGKDDMERAALAVMAVTPASATPVLVKMLLDLPAGLDPEWEERQLRGQMYYWAVIDPAAAAEFADRNQEAHPGLVGAGILENLAASDPVAAERWMEKHPELRGDRAAVHGYVVGLYQQDPAMARRYLMEHATEEVIGPALQTVALHTLLSSSDEAAKFIRDLPTKEARRIALDGIVDMNTEIFAGKEASETSIYAGVADWVTKFPTDEWPYLMPGFIRNWHNLDPNGSVNWMAQLPPSTRPAVASALLQNLTDPEVKAVLATASGDFHRDILSAYGTRLPSNPEIREQMIAALNLPSEDAAALALVAH